MRIVPLLGLLISLTLNAQVWEPLNGPLAVEVSEVKVNSNDVLFFITSKGLHRSLDNGDTWELLDNGLPTTGLSDLLVAPNNHVFVFGPGSLLYRSVDDGVSWSVLGSFFDASCLAANAQGVLLMGMGSGNLSRSFDDGNTWTLTLGTAAVFGFITTGLGDTLYSGYDNWPFSGGAFRSFDGGATWSAMGLGGAQTYCIGVNASGHVFAGTDVGMTGLMRSTDAGTTWTPIDIDFVWDIMSVSFNSSGHVFISTRYSGVLRSVDNGDTWNPVNTGLAAQSTKRIVFNSSDHVFAASSSDLYRSTDGGLNWSGTNSSFGQTSIKCVHVNDNNDYFVAAAGGVLHRSVNAGSSWQTCNAGLVGAWITDVGSGPNGHLFASTLGGQLMGGVFGSVDNGNTWNMLTDTTGDGAFSVTTTSNGDIYASIEPTMVIARSTDNGATWLSVFPWFGPCSTFDDLVVGGNDVVFASGRYCGDIVYSTAWGIQELVPGGAIAIMTALSARSDSTVLAARDGIPGPKVFRSENNGLSWQEASFGLPDTTVNALLCHPTAGLSLASTPLGVYITNNDGDEWWPFSDGLTNMDVRAFAIDQSGLVLAGTAGSGVFRASLPVSVPEVDANAITLEQNVPNPCDGNTTIVYTLSTSSHVQLVLLDAHGRTVAQLVDAEQPLGHRTVELVTAGLSPGLYAYSLIVDGQRLTKRMMVVR